MLKISPANNLQETFENNGNNIIPMNRSARDNGKDNENANVNQNGTKNYNIP